MTQKQHTTGAIRAASKLPFTIPARYNIIGEIAEIIDEETHAPEMLAFIEKVAAWDFDNTVEEWNIKAAQTEAFKLINKIRG